MSDVYFIPCSEGRPELLGAHALELLKILETKKNYAYPRKMPIKVHFGEKGNTTFIPAETYDPIIHYLSAREVEPFYIETNVLYRGERTTTEKHVRLARAHGFTQIPIVIADGETGTDYVEVPIHKDYIQKCKIGKAYDRYPGFLVMSHFKGHMSAGFGGAIKQLAMGFASRGGKLDQHSGISPVVDASRCIACGICVDKCDFDAITLEEVAVIHDDQCVGCAGCIAVCPEGAIRNRWDGRNFLEKIAEYAYGASLGKDNLYISFLTGITEDCDCIGQTMKPLTRDIGVLASTDPLALDAACLDLLQKTTGHDYFNSGRVTLDHGVKIGLGSDDYTLHTLDKEDN